MKRFLRALFIVSAVIAAGLPLRALAEDAIGIAAVVRGKVTVTGADGAKRDLSSKDQIYQNDTITTGAEAQAQIIFNDETIFTVGRNSEVILDTFVYNPETHEGSSVINVTKGFFKFLTGKIAKTTPQNVKVKTPVATIGIRGSGGIGSVGPDGVTTVGLTVCCLDVSTGAGTVPLETPNFFTKISDPAQPPSTPVKMNTAQLMALNNAVAGNSGDDDGQSGDGDGKKKDGDGKGKQGDGKSGDGKQGDGGKPAQKEGGDQKGNGKPAGNGTAPKGDGKQGNNGGAPAPKQQGAAAPAGGTRTAGAGAPPPPPGPGGALAAPPPVAPNVGSDLGLNTAVFSQDNSLNTSTNDADVPDTHFGIYRVRRNGNGFDDDELGDVSANIFGGQLRADFDPEDTTEETFKGILPKPPGTGAVTISPFLFDDESLSGQAFISPNDSMIFYDLHNVDGDRFILNVGRPLDVATLPTSNPGGGNIPIFFGFLKDPLQPATDPGFFDLEGSGAVTLSQPSLLLDLQRRVLLAGDLDITGSGSTHEAHLRVAFGRFDTSGTGNTAIDGSIFGYDSKFQSGSATVHGRGKTTEGDFTVPDLYGIKRADGNVLIDGFLLGVSGDTGNAFTNGTNLQEIHSYNPTVVTQTPSDAAQLFNGLHTGSQVGFSAGFLTDDVLSSGAAPSFTKYLALDPGDVAITKSAANTVGAILNYTQFGGGSGPASLTIRFGDAGTADSVLLSDKVYAADIHSVEYNGTNSTDFEGVLISEIAAEPLCSQCQFAQWGVWAAKINVPGSGADDVDVAELIPYVAADTASVTPFSSISSLTGLGSVVYNGRVFGSTIDTTNTSIQHGYGDLAMTINFGSSTITNLDITNFNGFNINAGSGSISNSGGMARFNIPSITGGDGTHTISSGAVNGLLLGPNAEEILGRFDFDYTGGGGAGVLQGKR
ncbi:MAG: hypothetical protein GC134_08090 [Proteobacteria bacterium]|nr:hypothetical protein [Pseudomonadota bacterium]